MAYIDELSGDILFDGADKPIKGVAGGRAVLIDFKNIDMSASTVVGATISDLVLKAGTTGYKLEWYKELASAGSEFAPNSEDIDGFTQSFLARLSTSSADHAERAKELSQGRFAVVYESRYKGADGSEAFKVLGFQVGLELSEMTHSTNEMSGSILFTLATKEGTTEDYPFQVYSNLDYDTSKADVDALFTAVI